MKKQYPVSLRRLILLPFFLLIAIICADAQDVIILKTGEKLDVQILEINDLEVKYREYQDPGGIIFTMSRGKISEIRYASGRREKEEEPGYDPAYYVDDRVNNIKINFLTPGGAHTILTYERGLNPTSSLEGSLKINGLGFDNYDGKSGVGLDFGYKVKMGSLFKKRDEYRPKHLLEGGYIRPVLGFNTASFDDGVYRDYTYAHLGLDLGTQWIIRNAVSLELFIGWHYYGGDFNTRFQYNDIYYGDWTDGSLAAASEHTAVAFGFNVGVLFGKGKVLKK